MTRKILPAEVRARVTAVPPPTSVAPTWITASCPVCLAAKSQARLESSRSSEKAREADVDGTLLVAAGGLRELLEDGKYDAIVAERFDEQSDKVSWARENMDPSTCRLSTAWTVS